MRLTIARFPKLTFKKWVELASNQVGGWGKHNIRISVAFMWDTTHTSKYGKKYVGLSRHVFGTLIG